MVETEGEMEEGDNMATRRTHTNGDLQTSCPRRQLHLYCLATVMLLAVKRSPDSADMPKCLLDMNLHCTAHLESRIQYCSHLGSPQPLA